MDQEDARLALLEVELNNIQSGIRGLDTILFQIKGWCVTVSLAIGGFAAAQRRPALLVIGAGAIVGFYLVQCQFKLIQRAFINRNKTIDSKLRSIGVMNFLKGQGDFEIIGTTPLEWISTGSSSFSIKIRDNLPSFWREARTPSAFSLYLFILVCLAVEGAILA
jgi:hypothetical protein